MGDRTGGMGKLAEKAAVTTDAELSDEEAELLLDSAEELARLKPKISDQRALNQLIAAVNRASQQNDDVAALSETLKGLGSEVMKVAKLATTLLG